MINKRNIFLYITWLIAIVSIGITFELESHGNEEYQAKYQKVLTKSEDLYQQNKVSQEFREKTINQRNPKNINGQLNISLLVQIGDDQEKQKAVVDFSQNVTFLAQIDKKFPLLDKKFPLIGKVFPLCERFIEYKQQHGMEKEKILYKDMTLNNFIQRLFTKRPLAFCQSFDQFLLRNGEIGRGGFENLGTDQEDPDNVGLTCKEYITYDEMLISALLGHASKTFFINDGARHNNMEVGAQGSFEPEGYYAGLVGARFEVDYKMDYQHIVISKEQNTSGNGYGKNGIENNPLLQIWAQFYGIEYFPSFDEIDVNDPDFNKNYIKIPQKDRSDTQIKYFNISVYKKRMSFVIEPYLKFANEQAKKEGKQAYVIAIGLGIGNWSLGDFQKQLLLETYKEIILQNDFENISDINFSCFSMNNADYEENSDFLKDYSLYVGKNEIANQKNINIIFSKRNPAARLIEKDEGKLLVAMYAWDSNAYVGNEFWVGSLTASGDPAAAACSLISILQNPDINEDYLENIIKWVQDYETRKGKEKEKLNQYTQEDLAILRNWWLSQKSLLNNIKNKIAENKSIEWEANGPDGHVIVNFSEKIIKTNIKGKEIILKFEEFKKLMNEEIENKVLEKYNAELSKIEQEDKGKALQSEKQNKKPLSSYLPESSLLSKSTFTADSNNIQTQKPKDQKELTQHKEIGKTFFTANRKLGIAGIVFFVGVLMWLWQNNYFKHFGTPSFAFH